MERTYVYVVDMCIYFHMIQCLYLYLQIYIYIYMICIHLKQIPLVDVFNLLSAFKFEVGEISGCFFSDSL